MLGGLVVALSCLATACGSGGGPANGTASTTQNAASPSVDAGASALAPAATDQPGSQAAGGSQLAAAAQQQQLAQAMAFMKRPEQQRDLQTAFQTRASSHPAYCPTATFPPKRIDILFDPAPQFSADGTLTRGTIVYRATMQGCAMPVLLTTYVEAMPGMPLRFRSAVPGTTFADADLQERAVSQAVGAARQLARGCQQLMPVDTRLIGPKPDANGSLVPWSEYWLVGGCGQLISTKLDFTPDHAAKLTRVTVDAGGTRMIRAGATGGSSAGASTGQAAGGPVASDAPAAGALKVVASATGTSRIPLGGANIPGAKVAGTCLYRLQETARATAPDHVECLADLPARAGAATVCTASRGPAKGQMTVAITQMDQPAGSVTFACTVHAR